MADKYYDYLKPQAQLSFSDVVNQQITLLEAQQQRQASAQLKANKERQKTILSQEKELLGFDTENFSDVHKEAFHNKLLHTRAKVNGFYYTGAHQSEFFEDIMALKELHGTFKRHSTNVKSERQALEGWVTGTKEWTDRNNELKDDMTTLTMKNDMWQTSGVDASSIEYDPATGDAYGYYTDINGNRLQDEEGKDMYGLISDSPTLGSKSYFSPTSSPYDNLLPGAFSKDFASAAARLKNNESMTLEEKQALLRDWVTTSAQNNPAVVATALSTFRDNYGENQYQSILKNDQAKRGEEEGYIPLDMIEYIDETMRFLEGTLQDASGSDTPDNIFPSSVAFNLSNFPAMPENQMDPNFTSDYGAGISALMVPKAGVGKSGVMIESTYTTDNPNDPRYREVSDQYRVLGVAMDNSSGRNLFVRAEMYIEEDVSNLGADRLARLAASLPAGVELDMENETVRTKVVKNFVVAHTLPNGETNHEYQSILGQIGYAAGATDGDLQSALTTGMQTLINFNDQQAQIHASADAANAQNVEEDNPNQQMMDDIALMNLLQPALEKEMAPEEAERELASVLNYVHEYPEKQEEILQRVMNGELPYIDSTGQLRYATT